MLGGTAPQVANGNLLLDQLLGANVHWAGEHRKGETIPKVCEALSQQGKTPYRIPYGGSNKLGALGFVDAIRELATQLQDFSDPVTHVVFASSSGGTQAGMMVGKMAFRQSFHVVGIKIDKHESPTESFDDDVLALAQDTAQLLALDDSFSETNVNLREQYTGAGYGVIGEPEQEAMAMLAQRPCFLTP